MESIAIFKEDEILYFLRSQVFYTSPTSLDLEGKRVLFVNLKAFVKGDIYSILINSYFYVIDMICDEYKTFFLFLIISFYFKINFYLIFIYFYLFLFIFIYFYLFLFIFIYF